MNRLLNLLHPVSAYGDSRINLPAQFNRSEVKIFSDLVQHPTLEDASEREQVNPAHKVWATTLYFHITDTPLP